jgi:hypothetical protein
MGSAHDDTLYYEQEARRRAEVNTMIGIIQKALLGTPEFGRDATDQDDLERMALYVATLVADALRGCSPARDVSDDVIQLAREIVCEITSCARVCEQGPAKPCFCAEDARKILALRTQSGG